MNTTLGHMEAHRRFPQLTHHTYKETSVRAYPFYRMTRDGASARACSRHWRSHSLLATGSPRASARVTIAAASEGPVPSLSLSTMSSPGACEGERDAPGSHGGGARAPADARDSAWDPWEAAPLEAAPLEAAPPSAGSSRRKLAPAERASPPQREIQLASPAGTIVRPERSG